MVEYINNNKGWLAMPRSIFEHPLYFSKPFTYMQALMDLYLLANHKEQNIMVVANNRHIVTYRGEVGKSKENLRLRWQWKGKTRVDTFFKVLVKLGEITTLERDGWKLVKLLHYEKFYYLNETETGSKKVIRKSQQGTINNDNNDNNDNTLTSGTTYNLSSWANNIPFDDKAVSYNDVPFIEPCKLYVIYSDSLRSHNSATIDVINVHDLDKQIVNEIVNKPPICKLSLITLMDKLFSRSNYATVEGTNDKNTARISFFNDAYELLNKYPQKCIDTASPKILSLVSNNKMPTLTDIENSVIEVATNFLRLQDAINNNESTDNFSHRLPSVGEVKITEKRVLKK